MDTRTWGGGAFPHPLNINKYPTSNHNQEKKTNAETTLYIIPFLHQTTTQVEFQPIFQALTNLFLPKKWFVLWIIAAKILKKFQL